MKRDMDLVRQILIQIESAPTINQGIEISVEGHSEDEIAYHLMMLSQAGYINAHDVTTFGGVHYIPTSLTWAGQDFLDAARDDTRWNKAKSIIIQNGSAMTLEILKMTLINLGKQALGLPPS